jgi:molecular chaperone GrpE (heat shock protein)
VPRRTHRNLIKAFSAHHLTALHPLGEKFNPELV